MASERAHPILYWLLVTAPAQSGSTERLMRPAPGLEGTWGNGVKVVDR